jgi:hypothetical protein
MQANADLLLAEGRILEQRGAPYDRLFPLVDCNIIHGGLGTTAEAIKAAKPCIVTGVLLMDQRFWGQRVHEMGLGPPPLSIRNFAKTCPELVEFALAERSPWLEKAEEKADRMKEAARVLQAEDDGVGVNVKAVLDSLACLNRGEPILENTLECDGGHS